MDKLFLKGSQNRQIWEIDQMASTIQNETFILRQAIREYISRLIMNSSEESPAILNFNLEVEESCGLSSLQMPYASVVWQDSPDGTIYVMIDENIVDLDDIAVSEQIQILRHLIE
jgi:hypothetical protein